MSVLPFVIKKEFLQLRRDRRMLPIVVLAPVLQLVLLDTAARSRLSRAVRVRRPVRGRLRHHGSRLWTRRHRGRRRRRSRGRCARPIPPP